MPINSIGQELAWIVLRCQSKKGGRYRPQPDRLRPPRNQAAPTDRSARRSDYPYGFLMGVECDGATYHSAKAARDRDRLREEVLKTKGWDLHRIWSTDWFTDPRSERDKMKQRLDTQLAAKLAEISMEAPPFA